MNKELIDKIITYNYNEFGNEFGDCIVDMKKEIERLKEEYIMLQNASDEVEEELQQRIDKAIEVIDLVKPELWNISNKMTYRLLDIKNILVGADKERKYQTITKR